MRGIGIDLENVARFEAIRFGENREFYEKIFTPEEIRYCLGFSNPYPHFAARFCAKEALIKACGKKLDLKKIEIVKSANAPQIRLSKGNHTRGLKNAAIHLSLAHTKTHAVAVVVIE